MRIDDTVLVTFATDYKELGIVVGLGGRRVGVLMITGSTVPTGARIGQMVLVPPSAIDAVFPYPGRLPYSLLHDT